MKNSLNFGVWNISSLHNDPNKFLIKIMLISLQQKGTKTKTYAIAITDTTHDGLKEHTRRIRKIEIASNYLVKIGRAHV